MAYIGKTPTIGNFQVCDAISVVNGQAAYTMQVSSVNVSPESANHMLVSLNGILQKAGSSFTVSGSTITFASNLVTGDVIDFIQILGNVLDLGVPSDNTVSLAKLTATGTKDATTFLRGDNTFDVPPLGGITMIDQWRIIADANYAGGTNDITGTWERNDTDGAGLLGSAMSVSSGVFTFPSTGYYYITAGFFLVRDNTTSRFNVLGIRTTQNNSSYNDRVQLGNHVEDIAVQHTFVYADYIFDVTDTSTHKAKFVLENDGSITLGGDTSKDRSFVRFIRLGDT